MKIIFGSGSPWWGSLGPLVLLYLCFFCTGEWGRAVAQIVSKPQETCKATLDPNGIGLLQPPSDVSLRGSGKGVEVPPVTHPAFIVKSSQYVPEYDFQIVEYIHKTGISVWSVSTPAFEREMTFSVCFRTPVADSYGTPHVLEHAVLEGSRRYPVHSVFQKMSNRSLNTYINASTWPDRTCYPFASLNMKDFYNLAAVYMDAVFFPHAVKNPLILAQEGWRYELVPKESDGSGIDCSKTPDACVLKYTGVVLSEMKGVSSNPDNLLFWNMMAGLFPEISTYTNSSGGLPAKIPGLTFEHLKRFHAKHYSPENAWITFYGPDDVGKRLQFVDEFFKGLVWSSNPESPIRIDQQVAFNEPRYSEHLFPSSASPLTDRVAVSWVLNPCSQSFECEGLDSEKRVALEVLSYLLLGTKASPLYKALSDSKLGTAVHDPALMMTFQHAAFVVEMKRVEHRDGAAAEIESLILKTLSALLKTGFRDEEIAAALNTVEFMKREFPRDQVLPRGLKFTRLMNNDITYGRDPIVRFEKAFKSLRKALAEKTKVFENLIDKYLLRNPHRLTLRLKASATMAAEVAEEERKTLDTLKGQMTTDELKAIIELNEELKKQQETPPSPEALATLPKIEREDIDHTGEEIPIDVQTIGSVPLVAHELPTSGLIYFDIALSLVDLSLDDIPYLPLLSRMLSEAGTTELPPEIFLPLIGSNTGGITSSYGFNPAPSQPYTVADPHAARGFLFLSGKVGWVGVVWKLYLLDLHLADLRDRYIGCNRRVLCMCVGRLKALSSRSVDLWCILHASLVDTNFGNSRSGIEIIKQLISDKEEAIRRRADRTARRATEGSFATSMLMYDLTGGYTNLSFYRNLLKEAESDWDPIAARLSSIMARLLHRPNMALNVTGDRDSLLSATDGFAGKALMELVEALPGGADVTNDSAGDIVRRPETFYRQPLWATQTKERELLQPRKTAYIMPTQVSYSCLTVPLSPPGAPIVGSEVVGASYLENNYLHNYVRERLGAYGVWSRTSDAGLISFVSYRNPRALDTLQAFRSTPSIAEAWAEEAGEDELLEALIPAIHILDRPDAMSVKGRESFWQWVNRETPHHRNKFRSEVIHANKQQLKAFASKLRDAFATKPQALALFGPEAAAEEIQESGEPIQLTDGS